ncbi:MAG: LysR family transcriptional regulator [Eubacteriales bacterium]|nr:LysR family transcriptional regulator [Eubacteriales bacterium]
MIQKLAALQKVVELGSFTKAADALGYTQSSVSAMVAAAEETFGIRILRRSRSGVHLTKEGKELFPYIQGVLEQYRRAEEKADSIRGLERGVVKMAVPASLSENWMPRLISGFREKYPDILFELFHMNYTTATEEIRRGIADMGITTPAASGNLETIPIREGEMKAILPKGHPLAALERVPIEELAKETFVLLDTGEYNEIREAFRKCGIDTDAYSTVDDDYTIMALVEQGSCVSILSDLRLLHSPYELEIRPVDPPIVIHTSIGFISRDALSSASRKFLDYMVEEAPELP